MRLSVALAGCLWAAQASAAAVQVQIEGVAQSDDPTTLDEQRDRLRVETGAVDSLGRKLPHSGRWVRWRSGKGAFIVWTLRATVSHQGTTARLELQQRPGSDAHQLRFALASLVQHGRWREATDGTELPLIGTAVLHPALANGENVVFEIAMPIRDTDPIGSFAPELIYTAHLNDTVPVHRLMPLRPPMPSPMPWLPR